MRVVAGTVFQLIACLPCHAWADSLPVATPRFAIHPTFDRVVIGVLPRASFTEVQTGSLLVLHFSGLGAVAGLGASGHRLLAVEGGAGELTLRMAQGAHPHIWRLADRVVVDVADDAPRAVAKPLVNLRAHILSLPARRIAPSQLAEMAPLPDIVQPAPALPVAAVPLPAALPKILPEGGVAIAPRMAALPVVSVQTGSPAVTLLGQDASLGGPAILVPFGEEVGAAAFRRNADGHIVFDSPHPLDLGALKDDPVFGAASEKLLPGGMDIRIPLAPGAQVRLARRAAAWAVSVVHSLPPASAIGAKAEDGVLHLAANSPGRVVVLDDPTTGGKLLVGTQRTEGQSVPASHRSAEFALLATWQGVAMEPVSDRLSLQPVQDGFALRAADGPKLSFAWSDPPAGDGSDAAAMTRRFDLPDLPEAVLHNRLTQAMRDAALTPKLARFFARLRVAQAMLADGLDIEARAVLNAARADDPAHQDDPDAAGLSAIANWLWAQAGGGDLPAPKDFDPASLGGSDEARVWQALFAAGQPDFAGPAATLASDWKFFGQYPAHLRRRLLPAVGEALARGGQDNALGAFLAAFPDASLDLVRAGLLGRQGKTTEALAVLDALSKRPDRLIRAEALRDAVELRLATGKMDQAAAAAAMGRQIYAWRGGMRDVSLRLRVADLRAQAGEWRQALALLRETDPLFPEAHAQIHDAQTRTVADLLHGDRAARLSALDLIALADEAAPLLSAADADATLAPVLVDKLLALDLPSRAEPILRRLFEHENRAAPKAELGVRLAGLLADSGDAKGAAAVLDTSSEDTALDSPLVTKRGLLRAKILLDAGKSADALGVLSGLQGEAALLLQVKILEDRHDWPQAGKLLDALVSSPGFASRPDQAKRDMILRLANDDSQSGDMAALRRLRDSQVMLFASGPGAELFAVLTQEPIQVVGDLPRSGQELDAVRALPASLGPQ